MPANHMGITEGTVGRNINELDFPHLREVEQTLMQPKKLPSWEDSGTLCPFSLAPEHQKSKSWLTLRGQIPELHSWKLYHQWSQLLPQPLGKNLWSSRTNFSLSHHVPLARMMASVLLQFCWDKFKSGRQTIVIPGLNRNHDSFPWYFLYSFNSRTMSPWGRWPGKCSIK